jgi:uncharacterized protein YndB with AHSA1/START domain
MTAAMIETHSTALIPAPPAEVFAAITDLERMAEMSPRRVEIVSVEKLPGGLRKAHLRSHLSDGKTTDTHSESVEMVKDELIVTRSWSAPAAFVRSSFLRCGRIELERTIRLTGHRDGTVLAMDISWRFRPALLQLYSIVARHDQPQRMSDASLQRIRGQFLNWPTRESDPRPAERP